MLFPHLFFSWPPSGGELVDDHGVGGAAHHYRDTELGDEQEHSVQPPVGPLPVLPALLPPVRHVEAIGEAGQHGPRVQHKDYHNSTTDTTTPPRNMLK